MNNIIFFDLETTGVEVSRDKIVQICCIKFTNGVKEVKTMLLNPGRKIPKEASEIHGITDEMVKDCPTFKQVAKGINSFFDLCDIAGYNSNSFDIPLLSAEFAREGINFPNEGVKFVDVMLIERKLNGNKLSEVYKRYTGNELEGAHDAEIDVEATITILEKQIECSSLEMDTELLDKFSQGENERVDLAGKLYRKDGDVYFAFGKWANCKVLEHKDYAQWMLNGEFSRDTKMKLSGILHK